MATGNDARQLTPDFYQAMRQIIEQEFLDVFTAMPGQVSSYDDATKLAVVQPTLQVKYRDEAAAKNRPLISNVPVIFPKMGKAHVRFPVNPGDEGLVIWSQRSIDTWLANGGVVDPGDNRKFDYSDAFFLIGATSQTNILETKGAATSAEFVNDKMVIEILPSGKIKIKNDTAELLDLIDQQLTALLGEPFVFNKAALTAIKQALATLKG